MPLVAGWINDERIGYFNGARFPVSQAEQLAWFDASAKDLSKRKLMIQTADGEQVGLVTLFNLDHRHGHAELGVYVAPDHQRRGYAVEALRMLIRFAFEEMNLHKVYCTILDSNTGSVHLFERLGFRAEGVRREHAFTGGRHHDVLLYSLLRSEWS